MDCSLPGFSVRGIFQARTLECVAISFSRASSQHRHCRQTLYLWATREALKNLLDKVLTLKRDIPQGCINDKMRKGKGISIWQISSCVCIDLCTYSTSLLSLPNLATSIMSPCYRWGKAKAMPSGCAIRVCWSPARGLLQTTYQVRLASPNCSFLLFVLQATQLDYHYLREKIGP